MSNMGSESVFDRRWLDDLGDWCARAKDADGTFEDLYLERRLELRLHLRHEIKWLEETRTEGTALRRRSPGKLEIEAATGTSPRTIAHLLKDCCETRDLRLQRPLPPPDLDVPRGWREQAERLIDLCPGAEITFRLMVRRAAVIRPGSWHEIGAPVLTRVEAVSPRKSTLLTTWGHPALTALAPLVTARPSQRRWRPQGGARLPVVFAQGTTGVLIHELVGHLLEADLVAAGESPLVAADPPITAPSTLHVTDDPTRFDLPGAFDCDDEGIAARPVTLLESGAVRGVLCDRAGAEHLGLEAGRGRRSSWNAPPIPRLSNLVVAPGSTPAGDLEADVRSGLCIIRISGAAVDPRASRIVIRVEEGWELRNGRRRRPLAPCALSGTVRGVLAGIDPVIGDDATAELHLGWCAKDGLPLPTGSEAPTVLVREMEVL